MRSAIVALLCLVILCSFIVNIQLSSGQTDFRTAEIERMVNFLTENQFNESIGLCREAPKVAPNTYWLVSDNLWAMKALTLANQSNFQNSERAGAVAGKIETSLKNLTVAYAGEVPTSSNGLPKSYCHEAVLGEVVSPPYRTANNKQLKGDANYTLKVTVCDGAEMHDWETYADRLLVGALSCYWKGDDTSALNYYQSAVAMWNETAQGIQDNATSSVYSVYKLALLLCTSKILDQQLPFEQTLINRLYLQQVQDSKQVGFGGIVTDYTANGTLNGDANTETTAIVLIALLTPSQNLIPEMTSILVFAGFIAISAAVAVLTFKRPLKHLTRCIKR
jgi:hypothetical protein